MISQTRITTAHRISTSVSWGQTAGRWTLNSLYSQEGLRKPITVKKRNWNPTNMAPTITPFPCKTGIRKTTKGGVLLISPPPPKSSPTPSYSVSSPLGPVPMWRSGYIKYFAMWRKYDFWRKYPWALFQNWNCNQLSQTWCSKLLKPANKVPKTKFDNSCVVIRL